MMVTVRAGVALVALLSVSAGCSASAADTRDAAADKIQSLPGQPAGGFNFDQYAGYVTVDPAHGRKLFYWLQMAQTSSGQDAASLPLVLWLNGGPGCSSVGGGLMSELGAFFPKPGGATLQTNPWAWNTAANVVFLESPAGVGFSYSNDSSDYTTGDAQTAADTYTFLQGFLQRFPQFADTPFWVTGESYGGHYVPGISHKIVMENAAGGNPKINFKGFLVGNAWTVAERDNTGAAFDWYSHSIVDESIYNGILNSCNMSNVGPLAAADGLRAPDDDEAQCNTYQNDAMTLLSGLNIYDLYVETCEQRRNIAGLEGVGAASADGHRLQALLGRAHEPAELTAGPKDAAFARRHLATPAVNDDGDAPGGGAIHYDPCIGGETTTYLNTPAVQAAIHANVSGVIPRPWSSCSSVVRYSRTDLLTSMLPVYEDLLKAGISMMVYSGDVDGIVPTTGTKMWLADLKLAVSKPWRQWQDEEGQVGGYVTVYDGLTFATVRNAGHMVPYTQPGRALHMLKTFINGQPL